MANQGENESNDEWCVYCSDDEKYGVTAKKSAWEPPPSEIIKLFTILDRSRDEAFELEWQCPGRRGPSPTPEEFQEEEVSLADKNKDEKDDFDFMDEMSATKFTRAGGGGPKGSAKKKTTSLDGILSNMRRHRMMERELSKSTTDNK